METTTSTSNAEAPVLCEREDGLAIVTLNRPDRLNALSGPVMDALVAHIACRSCVKRQFGRSEWDVHDQPVPKAAAGRRVGVIAGYGIAFRSAWRTRPRQMRRLITSCATEAEVFREYMSFRKVVAVAKALAG